MRNAKWRKCNECCSSIYTIQFPGTRLIYSKKNSMLSRFFFFKIKFYSFMSNCRDSWLPCGSRWVHEEGRDFFSDIFLWSRRERYIAHINVDGNQHTPFTRYLKIFCFFSFYTFFTIYTNVKNYTQRRGKKVRKSTVLLFLSHRNHHTGNSY